MITGRAKTKQCGQTDSFGGMMMTDVPRHESTLWDKASKHSVGLIWGGRCALGRRPRSFQLDRYLDILVW